MTVSEVTPESTDAELWAEIYRLRAAIKGPPGFATWQDAAVDERQRRIALERKLEAMTSRSGK